MIENLTKLKNYDELDNTINLSKIDTKKQMTLSRLISGKSSIFNINN